MMRLGRSGRYLKSFFLETEILDGALNAATANVCALLTQLLRDDLCGGLRIEEAMPDDLFDDQIATLGGASGPALLGDKRLQATSFEVGFDLVVAWSGDAVFQGGLGGAQAITFTFNDHEQTPKSVIVMRDLEGTSFTNERRGLWVEGRHGSLLGWGLGVSRERIAQGSPYVKLILAIYTKADNDILCLTTPLRHYDTYSAIIVLP
jgi:hypothetical protein